MPEIPPAIQRLLRLFETEPYPTKINVEGRIVAAGYGCDQYLVFREESQEIIGKTRIITGTPLITYGREYETITFKLPAKTKKVYIEYGSGEGKNFILLSEGGKILCVGETTPNA